MSDFSESQPSDLPAEGRLLADADIAGLPDGVVQTPTFRSEGDVDPGDAGPPPASGVLPEADGAGISPEGPDGAFQHDAVSDGDDALAAFAAGHPPPFPAPALMAQAPLGPIVDRDGYLNPEFLTPKELSMTLNGNALQLFASVAQQRAVSAHDLRSSAVLGAYLLTCCHDDEIVIQLFDEAQLLAKANLNLLDVVRTRFSQFLAPQAVGVVSEPPE